MAINCYYINNNSFHGLQISNLNTQELLMHFIIVFSQLLNRSVKQNIRFIIKTSKLSILLTAYIVLALLRGGRIIVIICLILCITFSIVEVNLYHPFGQI